MNNLSHQAGSHGVRGGVDFLFNDNRITFPRAVRGSYMFASLASFLTSAYNNAVTNHRNVVTRNTNFGPGAYPTNPLPGFGEVTATGEPRSLQLGLRVRF